MAESMSDDLRALVLSYNSILAIETSEEDRVRALLASVAADLGIGFFEWSVSRGLHRYTDRDSIEGTTDPKVLLRAIDDHDSEAIFHLKDFLPHLASAEVCRTFRELADRFEESRSTFVLTAPAIDIPREIAHHVVHVDFHPPSRAELREMIRDVVESLSRKKRMSVELKPEDAGSLIDSLSGLALNQARQLLAYAIVEDGKLSASDIPKIIERKAKMIEEGGLLEYFPPMANGTEIGGFERLKKWLERARVGFSAEAKNLNLAPPRGVLFVGVQGCGKSLAAKFIGANWGLPLLKLDPGQLYDKYIGESEKNFRKAVQVAESMAPVVLWIDEIEKMFSFGAVEDADGGLSRRLFGTFLTWLQEKEAEVFVVGTANDLSRLPPELLRKGRFDEIFFVDLPNHQERLTIFDIHLQKRKQSSTKLSMSDVVKATEGFSGAEIEQAVVSALYRALHAKKSLDTELLLQEIADTIPLATARAEDIERLRSMAQGRFVPVR